MIAAGNVFWFPDDQSQPNGQGHYYVVLSDPSLYPDQLLLVNFGSWEDYKDDACFLEVPPDRNLPYLRHTSCIEYDRAECFTLAGLEFLLKKRVIREVGALPPDIFEQVLKGAAITERLPMEYEILLEDQEIRNP
jgi:hypothetical protein